MILVTGATGSNGSELVRLLSSGGAALRAMVRDPDRAGPLAGLAGVALLKGDFDDRASLRRALDGVERAFLLTPSTERAEDQQLGFVEAARAAGVRHLVKLSQFAASADSPVRFLRYHAAVEAAIRGSGMDWTFLRPNLFMQGLLMFGGMIREKGMFAAAAGEARVSVVDVRDNAAAAAASLTGDGHAGRTYDLTGPEALTHAGMAERLSEAAGRTIGFLDVPEGAMRDGLRQAGMPAWQAEGLVEDYAHYRRGEAAAVRPGVLDATGAPPRAFAAFAADHAAAFR